MHVFTSILNFKFSMHTTAYRAHTTCIPHTTQLTVSGHMHNTCTHNTAYHAHTS